jgi:hypothetical protein
LRKSPFDLWVRRVGGEPIGVAFLSGSQRFRVAVSVALAVGRFASGRARPLEGVIIDEGFGSLDRDGLQAMAEELKRLQRESALRRVVLVPRTTAADLNPDQRSGRAHCDGSSSCLTSRSSLTTSRSGMC